VAEPG